jgi:N-acetylated-alpha-linked acidic dipeptidase
VLRTLLLAACLAQPAPEAEPLRADHELLAAEPHMAGTPGDERTIQRLADAFRGMGIADVKVHEFWPLLTTPRAAEVEIVAPERVPLDLRERPVLGDRGVAGLDLSSPLLVPFNAYSGSGEVTGEVVYANRGTREDFAALRQRGIDCTGKVVITRYGGNYRGYKARFAEQAGAAALLIYTDPADSGYAKGLPYPEGTFANECCTQRGSIVTMPYQGDPLTPGVEATRDAPRVPESDADLPRIPVQPMGYAPAREVLSRMTGPEVPDEWQGGLPFRYRLTGGEALRVRVKVDQPREIKRTANVIATIPGARHPEEKIVIGCHHDAWVFGAGDPLCGTIVLLDAARRMARDAAEGRPPGRTVVFAAWGAEEWGIIGSSEWVEAHLADLRDNAVLYVNLDNAAMGPDFQCGSSPVLRGLIAGAAAAVPQARDPQRTIFQAWQARAAPLVDHWEGQFGSLGGGSDHVAFLCHAGIPSCSLGGSGARGYAYHSAYDSLHWYRRTVGDDYEPALMLSRLTHRIARDAADAPILPRDLGALLREFREHAAAWRTRATTAGILGSPESDLSRALQALDGSAATLQPRANAATGALAALGQAPREHAHRINAILRRIDAAWMITDGLPGRPWYKNAYAAPDEYSGYSAWVLPLLGHAVEIKDADALARATARYQAILAEIGLALDDLDAAINPRR